MMIRFLLLCILLFNLNISYGVEHKKHKHKTVHHKSTHTIKKATKPAPIVHKAPVEKPVEVKEIKHEPKRHFTIHRYHFQNPHLIRRSIDFAQNTKAELVDWVHRAVASLQYTRYRFGGTNFNLSRGTYVVDCSEYVDRLLNLAVPKAYASLVNSTHTDRPTSNDYYQFIKNLPDDTTLNNWEKVNDVGQLKAGDILVFRYNDESDGPGGHVMIVMDKPSQDSDDPNAYDIRVSDSAPARHSDDTRSPHSSGVGIGTLMLKENPETHEPDAYAWTVDSGWKRIDAVMAEPISTNS